MTREKVTDSQPGVFGLDLLTDENSLDPTSLRLAENVRCGEAGGATKRRGSQRLTAAVVAANPVLNGYSWVQPSAVTELVVINGTLYKATFGIPTTFSSVVGALAAAVVPAFASFRDGSVNVCYIADGGPLNKFDGTTLTINLASTPNVKLLAVYNERLFGATGDDETIYWSGLGNGDGLGVGGSGGGSASVRTFGRQKVTGLLTLGDSLLVLHQRGISRFTGISKDDIAIAAGTRGYSVDVGTTAPRSLVAVDHAAMVATERGVYWLESAVEPQLVSAKIATVFRSLASSDLANICAAHNRPFYEVLFFVPGVGLFAYNYLSKQWYGPWADGYLSPAVKAMWETQDSTGVPAALAGDASGWVRQCDRSGTAKDNLAPDSTGGTTYTMKAKFHRMFCGDPATCKSHRWGYVTANIFGSSTFLVRWQSRSGANSHTLPASTGIIAWDDPGTEWDEVGSTWDEGSGTGMRPFRVPMDGWGESVDVTIEDAGITEVQLSRFDLEAFNMGRRG